MERAVNLASIMKPVDFVQYEVKRAKLNYESEGRNYNRLMYSNKPDYSAIRNYNGFKYSLN